MKNVRRHADYLSGDAMGILIDTLPDQPRASALDSKRMKFGDNAELLCPPAA
jgi:hypothetical protein